MMPLAKSVRRFLRDEDGTLLAEAVIVLPFLLWSYLALFVYWDAYRAINTVQKASYTISDMLSREQVPISEAYIVGMDKMMEYLIDQDQDAKIRVTSITWSNVNNRFEVLWSRSPGGALPQHTTASLAGVAHQIPKLANGDYVTLFEAEVNYHPAFNVGINDQVLRQFIVTRPRFVSPNCITGATCT